MTVPALGWLAQVTVTIIVLGAASALTTALLVQDVIPFGPMRERIWRRWPPRQTDYTNPREPHTTGTLFGYWWTCPRCAGVWSAAIWFAAFLVWPTGTVVVAVPFALAQTQRWWNART